MTWTYDGTPDNSTAAGRRDAVRELVGDIVTGSQQASDESIALHLASARDNIYGAASIICRLIAAKYARQVSTSVDGASQSLGERQKHYADLAATYSEMARNGVAGLLPAPYDGLVSEKGADEIRAQFRIGMHDRETGGITTIQDILDDQE
jgi:hypothetical protein